MAERFESLLMKLRLLRGISQEKLADALGVTKHTVSNWEVGRSIPRLTPRQYKALLRKLQITSDQLPNDFGPQEQRVSSSLRQLRELTGLTESDLARELSTPERRVPVEAIRVWESTGEQPSLSVSQLAALCDALGVTARQLADHLEGLQSQQEGES